MTKSRVRLFCQKLTALTTYNSKIRLLKSHLSLSREDRVQDLK